MVQHVHVLMRDEKEGKKEASKVKQTTRQSNNVVAQYNKGFHPLQKLNKNMSLALDLSLSLSNWPAYIHVLRMVWCSLRQ